MSFKDRTGEVSYNKQRSKMTIIKYISVNEIIIQFDDGYTTKNCYTNFKKGLIKNPLDKTIYGIGYLGLFDYDINFSQYKSYQVWKDMLYRCYNNKSKNYSKCSVCKEWFSFKNFKSWFDCNYYEVEKESMHLDKDILCKNNKIYSPTTCCFVPQTLNQIFQTHNRRNKKLPIGIIKNNKRYYISLHNTFTNKSVSGGGFDTIEDAVNYRVVLKRQYIYDLSQYYKNKIPKILYDKLIEYSKNYVDE